MVKDIRDDRIKTNRESLKRINKREKRQQKVWKYPEK